MSNLPERHSFAERAILIGASALATRKVSRVSPVCAQLNALAARVSQRIGRGCYVELALPARFELQLCRQPQSDWSQALRVASAHGVIEIADGARLLHALTGLHPEFLPSPSSSQRAWFESALAARLAETPLAGCTLPGQSAQAALGDDVVPLRVSLSSKLHAITVEARASASVWLALLEQTEWTSITARLPWSNSTALPAPVCIAQHTIGSDALAGIAAGDVLIPDSPNFNPQGEGRISLAGRTLSVRYRSPHSLDILAVEVTMQSDATQFDAASDNLTLDDAQLDAVFDQGSDETYADEMAASEAEEQSYDSEEDNEDEEEELEDSQVEEVGGEADDATGTLEQPEFDAADVAHMSEPLTESVTEPAPFVAASPVAQPQPEEDAEEEILASPALSGVGAIPVTLRFEMGRVALTLDALRNVGPGVVVALEGGSPSAIDIVAHGQSVGRGEIVDVDGQLGVRVLAWGPSC